MGCSASLTKSKYRQAADLADAVVEDQLLEKAPDKSSSSTGCQFSSRAMRIVSASAACATPSAKNTADAHHVPELGPREVKPPSQATVKAELSPTQRLRQDFCAPWDVDDLSYGPSFGPEELEADVLQRLMQLPRAYVVGGVLAKTDNCEVLLAARISDRTKVVVKRIDKKHSAQPYPTHVNEVRCLDRLRHPCIVTLLGVVEAVDGLDILLEYCDGGALRNFVQEDCGHCLSLLPVLCDVISALAFMHGERFAHLDVKPHNVLIKSGHVSGLHFLTCLRFALPLPCYQALRGKLCDLGTTTRIGASSCLRGLMGTPGYRVA